MTTPEDESHMYETIYELIDEYIETEAINMSSPNFTTIMADDIEELLHTQMEDLPFLVEENEEEEESSSVSRWWEEVNLSEMVEECIEQYFHMFSDIQPCSNCCRRSSDSGDSSSFTEIENEDIANIEQKLQKIREIPQPEQRSPEWYEFRNKILTASNIWKVFKSDATRNQLIYEKCIAKVLSPSKSNFGSGGGDAGGNGPISLQWGVLYEPVSVMLYETMYNTKIGEFGCIAHPEYPFLGASPDGINIDPTNRRYFGRMLEIKNPYTRIISSHPKQEYWIQMQVQMEVCDLDECDFLETQFREFRSESDFYQDHVPPVVAAEPEDTSKEEGGLLQEPADTTTIILKKGVILHFAQKTNTNKLIVFSDQDANWASNLLSYTDKVTYKYLPLDIEPSQANIEEWIEKTKKELNDTHVLLKKTYWYLENFSCIRIKRNRRWFAAAIPLIKSIWDTIQVEYENGYSHRMPGNSRSNNSNNSNNILDLSKIVNGIVEEDEDET